MRQLLFIFFFILGCGAANSQSVSSDYTRARAALQQNKLDSSTYYANKARHYFTRINNADSLALTLALETQLVWEKETLPKAIASADSSSRALLHKLPAKSAGRVALNSIAGSLYASKYRFDSARIFYERGLKAADTARPHLPLVILYMNISRMEMLKENMPGADEYYTKAYNALQAVNASDEITLADLLITRTQNLIVAGNYNTALESALRTEELLKKNYQSNNPKLAKNYGNIATVYYYLSHYEQALVYRQKALNVYLQNSIPDISYNTSFYVTYYNMGQLYYYLNENSLAANYLRKALHIASNVYGSQNLGIVNTLVQFGSVQQKLKKHDQAKTYFEEAYRIQKELNPTDISALAYIESFYADVFADERNFDSAIQYYLSATTHYNQLKESQSYYALYTKAGLGNAYAQQGNTAAALPIQKDVLKQFRKNFPFLKQPIVEFYNDIATTYLKARQLDSAKLYADSSILFQTELKELPDNPADWLSKLPFSLRVSEQVKIRLGILYEMYQQSKEPNYLSQILKTVEAYSIHIAANIYTLRTQHSLVEQSEVNKAIFSAGIDASWEMATIVGGQQYLEKAFILAEQGKALLLRLASNNFMIDGAFGKEDAVIQRDIALRKHISGLNAQYLNAEGETDSLLRLLTASIETYRSFQDSLKRTGNTYFNKRYAMTAFPVNEIRKELLKDNATLIEYALTDNFLYTFVITKDSFYVKQGTKNYGSAVKTLQDPQRLSVQAFQDSASRLYKELIKPIEPYLSSRKLIIIPDADLYYLNFETLVTGIGKNDFSSLDYLLNQYNISYLLSANVAVQLAKYDRKDETKDRALLFAPVFTDVMKQLYKEQVNMMQDDSAYLQLFRQPFALQAARKIRSLMSADMFVEQQAQESAFKKNSSHYKIVHLGTHAQANDIDPLQSKLFFAKSLMGTPGEEDGILYAYEIYAMRLDADLAVLTACETGTGALHSGEGVMSLAHSFMFAGCSSVVMSLWKIDEKTNAQIITDFYKYLHKGYSKSEALRKAKLTFLKKNPGELSNPFYWAGLSIIGDDTALYTGSNSFWPWTIAALLALAVAAFFLINKRKHR